MFDWESYNHLKLQIIIIIIIIIKFIFYLVNLTSNSLETTESTSELN